MSAIRPEFHTSLVSRALEDVLYGRTELFYFLGKIDSWGGGDTPPTVLSDAPYEDASIRDNILYMQKVLPTDTSLVIPSYPWESGTIFTQWDDTQVMKGEKFYCVTDEFNVYKCLHNNYGAPSTYKPTSTSLFPFTTPDGYLWKYMYNVASFKRSKFLSRDYIPVQRALIESFFNRGAVEEVNIDDGGSGYVEAQLTTIAVSNTTTGAGATAKVNSIGPYGQITSIQITNPGYNYSAGAYATVTSTSGQDAVVQPLFTANAVSGFTIVNGGYGYVVGDTVNILVGGAVLTPVLSRTTGSITSVRIDNPGAGYATAPVLTVNQAVNTGTGKYGNATAIVSAVVYQGKIVNVTVTDPGINYPADTSTTIVVEGDGTGASFTPVIFNGEIIEVLVDNPGQNYSYMDLRVVGQGTGAQLTPILARSDFLSDQTVVEQVAVPGAIYGIEVTNGGDHYTAATTVVIEGDGVEATAHAVVNTQTGAITKVVMDTYGKGYTYVNVKFVDPTRLEPNSFVDATAYAILPPAGGHGSNAPKELYADTLCVFSLLRNEVELMLMNQDYRQYGLVQNPVDLFTRTKILTTSNSISFKVTLRDVTGLAVDNHLLNNNKRYRVVKVIGNQLEVQQLSSIYAQPNGTFYKEGALSTPYDIISVDDAPNVDKYSGDLLYVTNQPPFKSTDNESIAIRTYITL